MNDSDSDVDDNAVLDDNANRSCYIFKSLKRSRPGRPSKKERVDNDGVRECSWPQVGGQDKPSALVRKTAYQRICRSQSLQSENHDRSARIGVRRELQDFLNGCGQNKDRSRIPTALLSGSSEGFDKIFQKVRSDANSTASEGSTHLVGVTLQFHSGQNLLVALRSLIKEAIISSSSLEDYHEHIRKHKRFIPLDSDLELLELWATKHDFGNIAVYMPDVETFGGNTLTEFVQILHFWLDRIPFVLILGVTSTIELFESRLSKLCLNLIDARLLYYSSSGTSQRSLICQPQLEHPDSTQDRLLLGPSIIRALCESCAIQGKSTHGIQHAIRYTYLIYYFASPFVAPLDVSEQSLHKRRPDPTSVRAAPSFRAYVNKLIQDGHKGELEKAQMLIVDDKYLLQETEKSMRKGLANYEHTLQTLHVLFEIHKLLQELGSNVETTAADAEVDLYKSIGNLGNSHTFTTIKSNLKTMTQEEFFTIKDRLSRSTTDLLSHCGISAFESSTLCSEALEDIVEEAAFEQNDYILHEMYLLNSRTIRLKQLFNPRPRATLERAWLMPEDYLNFDADARHGDGHTGVKDFIPVASILYTLLQEAPAVINVKDLFDAFSARLQAQDLADEAGEEDRRIMAMFYSGLAELKMLGLVKSSSGMKIGQSKNSRDIDLIAKTTWADL